MDPKVLITNLQASMYTVAISGNNLMQNYNIPQDELEEHERVVIDAYRYHEELMATTKPSALLKRLFRK